MSRFWDDNFQATKFNEDLTKAFMNATSRTATDFCNDMRKLRDGNKDLAEMNLPVWEPSAKQLNFLDRLARGDSH